jgi:peptidyl-prolyl cis-trans isomerase A (cyclophilin A)
MDFSRALLFSALTAVIAAQVTAQQTTPTTPVQPATAPASQDLPDAPQATVAASIHPNGPTVVMDTSMGRITCQFYQQQAPKAVANFIGLAEGTIDWTDPTTKKKQHHKPFYDGTTFHRVIPEFMIQGGDPTGTGMGGPGYQFQDETKGSPHKFDKAGKLAMANSGPGTNGSQFFITVAATPWLTGNHTIFGEVVEGQDVADKITKLPRNRQDKPNKDVVLNSVKIERV